MILIGRFHPVQLDVSYKNMESNIMIAKKDHKSLKTLLDSSRQVDV